MATRFEIVLHGTESLGTQEQSANSLATQTESIHYFIGRDQGLAYIIVAEEYQAFHAGLRILTESASALLAVRRRAGATPR